MKAVTLIAMISGWALNATAVDRPNFVLVMTDDQGWGQMGYYDHPVLKTPNLDAMAANGLRLDRFYAGAPNCSPTRATVMTGRTNDRTGVYNHGHALRHQEKVLPIALRDAGYATGHFGKWHLNGYYGPGVPVLAGDPFHPGTFGFDEWVSVSNFFDRDPLMSRMGEFEEFTGDSSEIIVEEALKFIHRQVNAKKPFFTVIWYGSPHDPWRASDDDRESFDELSENSQNHHGELVAMDRSVGTLRRGLRELGLADDTLVWFNSDNGGLPRIEPDTVGGLRGYKGSVYEGGLRVPAIIEWPGKIAAGRVSKYPAVTMDIFPTIAEIVGLPDSVMQQPLDGESLLPLFSKELERRSSPIGFRHTGRAAFIDNDYKLVLPSRGNQTIELYNLAEDERETTDLFATEPEIAERMVELFNDWNKSVTNSGHGNDYPEGRVDPDHPASRQWMKSPDYAPYVDRLRERREYRSRIERAEREMQEAIQTKDGRVEFEAEEGLGNWPVMDSPAGKAIRDPGDGQMKYNIIFDQRGRYYVFLLAKQGTHGEDRENDVLLSLDGRKLYGSDGQARPDGMRSHGDWKWTRLPQGPGFHTPDSIRDDGVYFLVETPGHYTFEIAHRSANIAIDKVLMKLDDPTLPGEE